MSADCTPEVPAGMREFTPEQFFDALRADGRDVMPFYDFYSDLDRCMYSQWRVVRTRELWGWSSDGRYAIAGGAK